MYKFECTKVEIEIKYLFSIRIYYKNRFKNSDKENIKSIDYFPSLANFKRPFISENALKHTVNKAIDLLESINNMIILPQEREIINNYFSVWWRKKIEPHYTHPYYEKYIKVKQGYHDGSVLTYYFRCGGIHYSGQNKDITFHSIDDSIIYTDNDGSFDNCYYEKTIAWNNKNNLTSITLFNFDIDKNCNIDDYDRVQSFEVISHKKYNEVLKKWKGDD